MYRGHPNHGNQYSEPISRGYTVERILEGYPELIYEDVVVAIEQRSGKAEEQGSK